MLNSDQLINDGIIAMNLGNIKESKKIFENVLEIDPQNIIALNKLGNIFGKLGSYQKAIECYDRVLSKEKNFLALINKRLA